MALEAHQSRFFGEHHPAGIVAFATARGSRNQMQADNKQAVRDAPGNVDGAAADRSPVDLLARHDRFPPAWSGAAL